SYPGGIRGLTCSPNGKLIAAVGLTSFRILEMGSGKELAKFDGRAFGVAFHPSSRWLAFSQEKDLLLWDLQTGKVVHKIAFNQLGMFDICFINQGRQLVSGGCNGLVGIWDVMG